jgi:chemotaxis signal transduction protein
MLVFTVGDTRYAMDVLHLSEVGRVSRLEPEPGASVGVLGIVRLHGRPVRLYDLVTVLDGTAGSTAPVAVHRQPPGQGGVLLAGGHG